jgi:hypothetical protein
MTAAGLISIINFTNTKDIKITNAIFFGIKTGRTVTIALHDIQSRELICDDGYLDAGAGIRETHAKLLS